jgi:hypothetical protein
MRAFNTRELRKIIQTRRGRAEDDSSLGTLRPTVASDKNRVHPVSSAPQTERLLPSVAIYEVANRPHKQIKPVAITSNWLE